MGNCCSLNSKLLPELSDLLGVTLKNGVLYHHLLDIKISVLLITGLRVEVKRPEPLTNADTLRWPFMKGIQIS